MPRNRSSNNRRQYPAPKSGKNKKNYVVETQHEQVIKVEPTIRKKFSKHDIKYVKPLTENQLLAFQEWGQGQHLVLEGWPGVGKSFLATVMALNTVLDPETDQDKIVIVRSATPTKDVGFLPGDLSLKLEAYESPYMQICDQLFNWKNSYQNLKEIGIIEFASTSYLRGTSFDNAVVIFDEFQCATEAECDTVLTRISKNSRIIICGDSIHQNDIGNKSGGIKMLNVIRKMDEISCIDFNINDIVRSDFVKSYLIAKYKN